MKRREFTALAAAASLMPLAHAQADRTIRVLVGFPPGGSIDIVSRVLAEKMKDDLKANLIIENRAGAGGRVAADLLKAAPADGTVAELRCRVGDSVRGGDLLVTIETETTT